MPGQHIIMETGRQRLIRARHGYVLYNRNDTVIGRLIETFGEYFESEVDVFRRFVGPGAIALDVGANIGTHTLALARMAGPGGLVVAFEPQRLVFQNLCANVALNSLDNVHCVNAAVGASGGELRLGEPDPSVDNNFGGVELSLLSGFRQVVPVPRVTLDGLLDVERLQLVKIDVEGMEAEVLRGAQRTLAALRPVLYVENDRVGNSASLLGLLRDLDYVCYWHLAPYVTAGNFFQESSRPFPIAFVDRSGPTFEAIGFAVNLLCVHKSLDLPIQGLRRVDDPGEHPFRRECQPLFAADGAPLPVIRA